MKMGGAQVIIVLWNQAKPPCFLFMKFFKLLNITVSVHINTILMYSSIRSNRESTGDILKQMCL